MEKLLISLLIILGLYNQNVRGQDRGKTLKETVGNSFLIGTAVNTKQSSGNDRAAEQIVRNHFNSIVAEGCMKSKVIHPEEGKYDFAAADQFVAFGEKNNQIIIGHTLIWHMSLSPWFCVDKEGKDVAPEILKQRMKEHITTVVSRFKGRVKGWDVVNEALEDDGTYRKTPFYRILGEEYIPLAFQYAHEADPSAELYYNDFNLSIPHKCQATIRLIKTLKERGLRIDAIGMQGHLWMGFPQIDEVDKSIQALSQAGVKIMITELDLTALPAPPKNIGGDAAANYQYSKETDPYPNGLPENIEKEWTNRMLSFFKLFLKHKDVITRVTLWGVSDADSWRNGWPITGRTDYPLLFDRNRQPKPVVDLIMKLYQSHF